MLQFTGPEILFLICPHITPKSLPVYYSVKLAVS